MAKAKQGVHVKPGKSKRSKGANKSKTSLCHDALLIAQARLAKAKENAKKYRGINPKGETVGCASTQATKKSSKHRAKQHPKHLADPSRGAPLDRPLLESQLKNEEGGAKNDTANTKHSYNDSKKLRTIGHGFNLDSGSDTPGNRGGKSRFDHRLHLVPHNNPRAEKDANGKVLDFDKVYDGQQTLTEAQSMMLFTPDVDNAIEQSKTFLSTYDDQPEAVKRGIADMTFNMGIEKVRKFTNLQAALEDGNYALASVEILNSQYCKDVGGRAIRIATEIGALADNPSPPTTGK